MTGNTVLLAIAVGQGHLTATLHSFTALIAFILGAGVGAFVVGGGDDHHRWPSTVTRTLALEAVVLAALSIAATGMQPKTLGSVLYVFIGLSAFAMGMQTAAVRRLGVAGLSTTVITTTMATVIEGFVIHLRASSFGGERIQHQDPDADPRNDPRVRHLGVQTAVIVSYAVAAGGSAVLESRVLLASFWLPTAIVAAVVLIASTRLRGRPVAEAGQAAEQTPPARREV